MTLPMVQALESMGYVVKYLIHPQSKNLRELLMGHEYKFGTRTKGKVAISILWYRCLGGGVSKDEVVPKNLNPKNHHESESNMTVAHKLGYNGKMLNPVIKRIKPVRNNTICILPGCRQEREWAKKKYPYWRNLCKKLSKKHKLSFLGINAESAKWMDGLGKNFCGKLNLRDSMNWIAGSKATISIDNGLAHISGAVGIPTNVIYGPTMQTKNRQLGQKVNIIYKPIKCGPCQLTPRWNACGNYKCMKLDPDFVISKLRIS